MYVKSLLQFETGKRSFREARITRDHPAVLNGICIYLSTSQRGLQVVRLGRMIDGRGDIA